LKTNLQKPSPVWHRGEHGSIVKDRPKILQQSYSIFLMWR